LIDNDYDDDDDADRYLTTYRSIQRGKAACWYSSQRPTKMSRKLVGVRPASAARTDDRCTSTNVIHASLDNVTRDSARVMGDTSSSGETRRCIAHRVPVLNDFEIKKSSSCGTWVMVKVSVSE